MSKGSPLTALARRRHRRKQRRILEYEFPEPLVDKLRERHPHLTTDDAHAVLDGLREWFIVCKYADGKMVGMPSRVVDDAWHEFILMTRRYHGFCKHVYGRYLHHTPSALAETPPQSAIPRALELLRRAGIAAPAGLPLLFTLDGELGIAGGRTWEARVGGSGGSELVVFGGGGCGGDCSGSGCGGDGCGGDGCGGCGGCCG